MKRQRSGSDKQPTVYVVIRADARPLRRDLKAVEARVEDVAHPRRTRAFRALLSPATIIRKALGEFDD